MAIPEPNLQVAVLESTIGGVKGQRIFDLKICLWHGEAEVKFTDLPPDAQEVLKNWVNGETT